MATRIRLHPAAARGNRHPGYSGNRDKNPGICRVCRVTGGGDSRWTVCGICMDGDTTGRNSITGPTHEYPLPTTAQSRVCSVRTSHMSFCLTLGECFSDCKRNLHVLVQYMAYPFTFSPSPPYTQFPFPIHPSVRAFRSSCYPPQLTCVLLIVYLYSCGAKICINADARQRLLLLPVSPFPGLSLQSLPCSLSTLGCAVAC